MKVLRIIAVAALWMAAPLAAQIRHAIRDAEGRHVVPRGFVVMTNDGPRAAAYSADDYARMVRMGANFQVIRLELGKLSTYPGTYLDEHYLARLDALVRLGRDVGIKTIFKMTTYGVSSFTWEKFWRNKNHERPIYLEAWQVVWRRCRADPSVWLQVGCGDGILEPRHRRALGLGGGPRRTLLAPAVCG